VSDLGKRLDTATAHLDPPLAVVDLDAFDANATDLLRRAGGVPIRVASKSVRSRDLISRALARPGFAGVLAYSLREAIWLVRNGTTDDVVVAYPTTDRAALAELAADAELRSAIAIMVDDEAQVALTAKVVSDTGTTMTEQPVRLCLDIDSSLRIGRVHLGVRRSPIRTPHDAARLARSASRQSGLRVVGVMFYEAQVAGLPDRNAGVRLV
jgi:D-serine deaminase-like pyridoxal phosphate-dependent protein